MSIGFATGLRALLTAKSVMDMIGHNLANQNTLGYSRQVALLTTTQPAIGPNLVQIGSGVQLSDIYSVRNESLLSRLRHEYGSAGRSQTEATVLAQIESVLGDLTDDGLAQKLQSMFDSADAAASTPEDAVLRQNVLASVDDVALGFRLRTQRIQDLRSTSFLEAQSLIGEANETLRQVADLNSKISTQLATGIKPNDLKDQRDVLLQKIAEDLGGDALQLQDGTVNVSVGGITLVSGATSATLKVTTDAKGGLRVSTGNGGLVIKSPSGKLGGLLKMVVDDLPERLVQLDQLAKNLILAANKVHARGIPAGGPFEQLKSTYALSVPPGVNPLNVALGEAGLPFDVVDGELTFAVTEEATGDVKRYTIDVDPDHSVQDFLDQINAIPELTAFVNGAGTLTLKAKSGYGFDFSRKLDAQPVEDGTFGAGNAVLVADAFPAALSNGSTLQIAVDGGAAQTVTFNSADFADITQATAAEVAAVFNAQATGLTAKVVDGRLVVSANSTGAASSLAVTDGAGSPAAAMGLALSGTGTGAPVTVGITGSTDKYGPDTFTFKPSGDGEIGITPGLQIDVFDHNGLKLATLDVGEGYDPGQPLAVVEGVSVTFSAGTVQGSAGQYFDLEVPGDADTAGVLTAFGLNSLFQGTDANTIDVSGGLKGDPQALAGAAFGGTGDGGNFLALSALAEQAQDGLGGDSITGFYNGFAADVGTASAGAQASSSSTALVILTLESQRASESGVNADEELLNLERFQSAYEAAGKFLSVLTQLDDVLLSL